MIKTFRIFSQNGIVILISLIFSTYLTYLTNIQNSIIYTIQIILWFLLLLLIIIRLILSNEFMRIIYTYQYKKKIQIGRVAILNDKGCPSCFTSITAKNWFDFFKENNFNVEYIDSNKNFDKYALVVNPYGEIYPENDLVELKTLKKIKKYIRKGGLFLNPGGCAFYYGWHTKYHKTQRLPKELQTYKMDSNGVLHPIIYPATSLIDMPLFDFFKVLVSTTQNPTILDFYQQDEDKSIVGDLSDFNSNKVEEFRAIRDIAPHCIPFIRVKIENSQEVYPICAVELNKGFLILAGINLNSSNKNSNKSQMQLIGLSVINFLNYLRENI